MKLSDIRERAVTALVPETAIVFASNDLYGAIEETHKTIERIRLLAAKAQAIKNHNERVARIKNAHIVAKGLLLEAYHAPFSQEPASEYQESLILSKRLDSILKSLEKSLEE